MKTAKASGAKKGAKKTDTLPEPKWRTWPLQKLSGMPEVVQQGLVSEKAEEIFGDRITTLGALADLLHGKPMREAQGMLCQLPGVGGVRAAAVVQALGSLIAASNRTRSIVDPIEREEVTGTRAAAAQETRESGAGPMLLEVMPTRKVVWPWAPFDPRLGPGGIIAEDDPLLNVDAEMVAKLQAMGLDAQVFDQRHKLWAAEDQAAPVSPCDSRVALRVYAELGYHVEASEIAEAPRADRGRKGKRRLVPAKDPVATAEDPGDDVVPEVDDIAALEAAEDEG